MPVQQQMSSFAKRMGGQVATANAEHKDKPVDVGMQKLPPGIKNGKAKLTSMYTKEYADDKNGPGTKGQVFFRASAVVLLPESHMGEKVAGRTTQFMVPLCDMPALRDRKAKSFSENYYEFQNFFKMLGVPAPNETPQTDPTGQKTEAYYFAAMKTLTNAQNPTYIKFSTRSWTPPVTPTRPKPTEMVFEDWEGLTKLDEKVDPAAGITETQPDTNSTPPPVNQLPVQAPVQTQKPPDIADEVASLVEAAMADPDGKTEDGAAASARLEKLAWAAGATKEQTAGARDWAQVGDMALGNMSAPSVPVATTPTTSAPKDSNGQAVTVGSKWKFAKRTKEGERLKNARGEIFPPQEVEVISVDTATKTCRLKSMKNGTEIVDIRTKEPVAVKFEWLES